VKSGNELGRDSESQLINYFANLAISVGRAKVSGYEQEAGVGKRRGEVDCTATSVI